MSCKFGTVPYQQLAVLRDMSCNAEIEFSIFEKSFHVLFYWIPGSLYVRNPFRQAIGLAVLFHIQLQFNSNTGLVSVRSMHPNQDYVQSKLYFLRTITSNSVAAIVMRQRNKFIFRWIDLSFPLSARQHSQSDCDLLHDNHLIKAYDSKHFL